MSSIKTARGCEKGFEVKGLMSPVSAFFSYFLCYDHFVFGGHSIVT